MVKPLSFLGLGAALLAVAAQTAVAQVATPVGTPDAPAPAECRVDPRPIGDLRALIGTPVPATPAAFDAPAGEPADPAVVDGVVATVRELIACNNAGDFLRQTALYTEAGLAEDFAGVGEQDIAFFAAPPTALPPGDRLRLLAVEDVVVLDDGRVGAVVVAYPPQEGSERDDYLVFVEEDGRYLVDRFVDEYDRPAIGTPTP